MSGASVAIEIEGAPMVSKVELLGKVVNASNPDIVWIGEVVVGKEGESVSVPVEVVLWSGETAMVRVSLCVE